MNPHLLSPSRERVYCRRYIVRSSGKSKTCRRCSQQTWDYDTNEDEWFCDTCAEWADV